MEDTIAAISTAAGTAGLGVIRISGITAISVAQSIFESVTGKQLNFMHGYSGTLGHIVYNGQRIDEAIVFVYKSPKSYTGEDVVEISCHGGAVIMQTVLRACFDNGARPAQAGEFTKRAFINGKMDLIQAEAVINVINSQGQASLKAAVAAKDGILSAKIDDVKSILIEQSSHIAAWCDYPDEDVIDVDMDILGNAITQAVTKINDMLSTYDYGRLITEGISTVIIGKPNVGKSTIMNLLSGYDRSIVTDIPGTTRDIIEDTICIGDLVLKIKDTAGIHPTQDNIEKIGVERSVKSLDYADLILIVFDTSKEISNEDQYILDILPDCPAIAVLNKSDLPNKFSFQIKQKNIVKSISISAKTGEGLDELISGINSVVVRGDVDTSQAVITNERQRNALYNASKALESANQSVKNKITLDAICTDIDYAIDILMSLTGENTSEKIIDEVFSKFCVGK